jgi:hypothetical protein
LQGRFEHGRIILNSEEEWDTFVDQLAVTSYMEDDDSEDWEPMDVISGV